MDNLNRYLVEFQTWTAQWIPSQLYYAEDVAHAIAQGKDAYPDAPIEGVYLLVSQPLPVEIEDDVDAKSD